VKLFRECEEELDFIINYRMGLSGGSVEEDSG